MNESPSQRWIFPKIYKKAYNVFLLPQALTTDRSGIKWGVTVDTVQGRGYVLMVTQ